MKYQSSLEALTAKNGVYSGNLHGRRKIHVEAKQKSVYSPRLHMAIGPPHTLQLQFSSFQ
jgi:hypothetical protein